MRIINIANGGRLEKVWTDEFVQALAAIAPLELREDGHRLTDDEVAALLREYEVALVGWDARPLPATLARDPGRLRYVCSYSGTIRSSVPIDFVQAGLLVSNWGDHPANGVAEAAMTLLLSVLKDIPATIRRAREGKWRLASQTRGTLVGAHVGLYGCGVIGRRFVELLRPFGPEIRIFDPYASELPEGCERAPSLEALLDASEILVVHAGLSDETRGSVTAEHFARLPDGGIVINTARGGIFDQQALFDELLAGRLRAGLDVLEPDFVEPDHPIRQCEGALLSFHQLELYPWPPRPGLDGLQRRCVENLARFAAGETPQWLFDVDRYERST